MRCPGRGLGAGAQGRVWGLVPVGSSQCDGHGGAGASLLVESGLWSCSALEQDEEEGGRVLQGQYRKYRLADLAKCKLKGTGSGPAHIQGLRGRRALRRGATNASAVGLHHLQALADEMLHSSQV